MTSAFAVALLQDDSSGPLGALGALFGGGVIFMFVLFAVGMMVVVIVGMWKVFTKAGQPGWACIVPFYNVYVMLQIAGRPGWWLILCLIPLVNVVIAIVLALDIAKAFGQSGAFGFFLLFLFSGIGYLILGFGSARYLGPPNQPGALQPM